MIIEIPTSPAVSQKIQNLFNDKVLKPKNMDLMSVNLNDGTYHTIRIDWKHGELSEIFFLGYWAAGMKADQNEFAVKLNTLSDLYEEGKDCLHSLSILDSERNDYDRLFDILKEVRDLSAVSMKQLYKPE